VARLPQRAVKGAAANIATVKPPPNIGIEELEFTALSEINGPDQRDQDLNRREMEPRAGRNRAARSRGAGA